MKSAVGNPSGATVTIASHPNHDEDWLSLSLLDAVRRNLRTKIMCTTCGALEFRTGLMVGLERAASRPPRAEMGLDDAHAIGRALARVDAPVGEASKMEAAVRLILFEIRRMIGAAMEHEVEPILAGTWAGNVLARMQAHQRAREEAHRTHGENQAHLQQRREEKQRLRQRVHTERLARKKERDRLWREAHGNIES